MVSKHLQLDCSICLDGDEPEDGVEADTWSVIPACGHVLHTTCLQKWFSTKPRAQWDCPICRKLCETVSERAATIPGASKSAVKRSVLAHKVLFFNERLEPEEMTQREDPYRLPGAEEEDDIEDIEDDDAPAAPAVGLSRTERDLMLEVRELKKRVVVAEERATLHDSTVVDLALAHSELAAVKLERDASLLEIEELKAEVLQLSTGQPDRVAEIERLNFDLDARDFELNEEKERYSIEAAEHAKVLKKHQKTFDKYRLKAEDDLQKLVKERDGLKETVRDAGRKPAERIRELMLLTAEFVFLPSILPSYLSWMLIGGSLSHSLRTEHEELERKHSIDVASLGRDNKVLEDKLAAAATEIALGKARIDELKSDCARMQSGLKSHQNDNAKLKKKLDLSRAELASFQARRSIIRSSASPPPIPFPPQQPRASTSASSFRPPSSPDPPLPFKINNHNLPHAPRSAKRSRVSPSAPSLSFSRENTAPFSPAPTLEEEEEEEEESPSPVKKKKAKGREADITISDSEEEDEDEDELEVGPARARASQSQPMRDGRVKPALSVLKSDKHLPVFGIGKVVERGPKKKVKSGGKRYMGSEPIVTIAWHMCRPIPGAAARTSQNPRYWITMYTASPDLKSHYGVIIVGSGLSGVAANVQLKRKGDFQDVICYEAEEDFGGTWAVNTFPGAAVDIPIVETAHYDQGIWTVRIRNLVTGDAAVKTCNILITAVGALRAPVLPAFAVGNTTFEGKFWHSAKWDHSVDYTGKRQAHLSAFCEDEG
ncbi:hypothetical protein RQP46_008157 [Phenoliferia psychrophenolica]